eukprot:scaffold88_cov387-Prasinococcus_capsulatus_cf.AAC.16
MLPWLLGRSVARSLAAGWAIDRAHPPTTIAPRLAPSAGRQALAPWARPEGRSHACLCLHSGRDGTAVALAARAAQLQQTRRAV